MAPRRMTGRKPRLRVSTHGRRWPSKSEGGPAAGSEIRASTDWTRSRQLQRDNGSRQRQAGKTWVDGGVLICLAGWVSNNGWMDGDGGRKMVDGMLPGSAGQRSTL